MHSQEGKHIGLLRTHLLYQPLLSRYPSHPWNKSSLHMMGEGSNAWNSFFAVSFCVKHCFLHIQNKEVSAKKKKNIYIYMYQVSNTLRYTNIRTGFFPSRHLYVVMGMRKKKNGNKSWEKWEIPKVKFNWLVSFPVFFFIGGCLCSTGQANITGGITFYCATYLM